MLPCDVPFVPLGVCAVALGGIQRNRQASRPNEMRRFDETSTEQSYASAGLVAPCHWHGIYVRLFFLDTVAIAHANGARSCLAHNGSVKCNDMPMAIWVGMI